MTGEEFKKLKQRADLFTECYEQFKQAYQDVKYLRSATGNEYADRRTKEMEPFVEKFAQSA